jgi:hypothetical protein
MRLSFSARSALAFLVLGLAQPAAAGDFGSQPGPAFDWRHSDFRATGFVEIPLGGKSGVWNAPRLGLDLGPATRGALPRAKRLALIDASLGDSFELRFRGTPIFGSTEGSLENIADSLESCFFGAESLTNLQCWAAYTVAAVIIGGGIVGGLCAAETAGLCDDGDGTPSGSPGGGSPGLGAQSTFSSSGASVFVNNRSGVSAVTPFVAVVSR